MFALLTVSATGLLQLALGPSDWGAPLDEFRDAGGYLGAVIALPLQSVLATAGATLVLVGLGVAGLLILTRATLRAIAVRAADGVRPVHAAARRVVGSMSTLSGERFGTKPAGDEVIDVREISVDEPVTLIYDVEAEDDEDVEDDVAAADEDDEEVEPDATDELDVSIDEDEPEAEPEVVEQLEIPLGTAARRRAWKLPALNLLARSSAQEVDQRLVEEAGRVLEAALAAHGVETRLVGMTVGPTVTRYELELAPGVKVAGVTSLNKDIAYAMASADVRILAPIPGRSAIGVEVPNRQRHLVALGDILSSGEARKATHPLEVGVGRDIAGRAVLMNLATHAAPPRGRRDGRGQVELHQLDRDLDPDAIDARPGAHDPRRSQARRDGPVQPLAPPAHAGRDEPEARGQRARVGGAGDGASLRRAAPGRRARHHRLQRGLRPR